MFIVTIIMVNMQRCSSLPLYKQLPTTILLDWTRPSVNLVYRSDFDFLNCVATRIVFLCITVRLFQALFIWFLVALLKQLHHHKTSYSHWTKPCMGGLCTAQKVAFLKICRTNKHGCNLYAFSANDHFMDGCFSSRKNLNYKLRDALQGRRVSISYHFIANIIWNS